MAALGVQAVTDRWLALLPETCSEPGCRDGVWFIEGSIRNGGPCIACHGSGKVYPAETVERMLAALRSVWPVDPTWWPNEKHAVRVLDALNGEARIVTYPDIV